MGNEGFKQQTCSILQWAGGGCNRVRMRLEAQKVLARCASTGLSQILQWQILVYTAQVNCAFRAR